MSVAVVVPWRDIACPHRTRALAFVLSRYATTGWPVVIGRHECAGAWCKALAVRDALSQTQAEVLILADADTWTDHLAPAVDAVERGSPWAVPHRAVHRLDEDGTRRWMAGEPHDDLPTTQAPYLGEPGGGILVIRREVYEDCGFDPRFVGWGQEDCSMALALRCIYGAPWRPTACAPLIHLFHPPQQRARRSFGCEASLSLWKRYARAANRPDAMRRIIEEAAQCLSQP